MNLRKRYLQTISENRIDANELRTITDLDIAMLPEVLRNYLKYCGFTGKKEILNQEVIWGDAYHRTGKKSDFRKLKYFQFISLEKTLRSVYIDAKIMEIEEKCDNGIGKWTMVLLKCVRLIDIEDIVEINKSALITFLSEFSLAPLMFLSEGLSFGNETDDSIAVSISKNNITVSGTFYFDETGFIDRFETDDRYFSEDGKSYIKKRWIGKIESYKEKDGIKFPGNFTASWMDSEGEFEYFNGEILEIRHNI